MAGSDPKGDGSIERVSDSPQTRMILTYQQIHHMVFFDCKFDGRRKGRLVAGGNHSIVTSEQVYSGMVGIETVRIILALSAMHNDLQVMAADISDAFLYGEIIGRTMIKAGPEFGD